MVCPCDINVLHNFRLLDVFNGQWYRLDLELASLPYAENRLKTLYFRAECCQIQFIGTKNAAYFSQEGRTLESGNHLGFATGGPRKLRVTLGASTIPREAAVQISRGAETSLAS